MKNEKQILYVKLWDPHPTQAIVRDYIINHDEFKFICVNASRGWGKTECLINSAIELALTKQRVYILWCSYSHTLNNTLFDNIIAKCTVYDKLISHSNKNEKTIVFGPTKSKIIFKSVDRPDGLRGQHPDYIFADEIAFWREEVWDNVLSGMTKRKDKGKKIILSSTPFGQNGIWWQLNQNITSGTQGYERHKWFDFTYRSNPYADRTAIEQAKTTMPRASFEQEFEAKFCATNASVFTNYSKVLVPFAPYNVVNPQLQYYMGVDIGQRHDSTAFTIIDQNGAIVSMKELRNKSLDEICAQVAIEAAKWQYPACYIEENNQGGMFLEVFRDYCKRNNHKHHWMKPINTNAKNKHEMITFLYADIETNSIKIPTSNEITQQFADFEVNYTAGSQYPKYGAPSHKKDDLLMSILLANYNRHENKPQKPNFTNIRL